jgi:hypothetical protein
MTTLLLAYVCFLTLFIVGFIHYSEQRVKDYQLAIEDYKRALNIAKGTSYRALYLSTDGKQETKRR